jgi:WS/DGAT/MGAT family acyltransferase
MLVGELLKTDDPQSPLKGDFALHKRVAWSTPVALKDIKVVCARYDARVNDVLVAALTGALRSYLTGRGMDVAPLTLRAMVPVDLRSPERAGQLGNEFGLVILELAVAQPNPVQRLALTKARMDQLKRSPEPVATRILMEILGHVPKALEDAVNTLFARKASLVITNVIGPREVLYLAGVPIDRMLAWAPHPGQDLGMAISILSYCGTASVTFIGDAVLVPDPQAIADLFQSEFQSLLRAAKARTGRAAAKPVAAKQGRSRAH